MTTETETPQGASPAWTVGDRIHKARRHAGLTAEQLATPLSVTRGSVSNWELGVSTPRPIFLREIARITGVDYEWLAGEGDANDQGDVMHTWIANSPEWVSRSEHPGQARRAS